MRVISGIARGTRLVSLGSVDIRPTLDRVKESFFQSGWARVRRAVFSRLVRR